LDKVNKDVKNDNNGVV